MPSGEQVGAVGSPVVFYHYIISRLSDGSALLSFVVVRSSSGTVSWFMALVGGKMMKNKAGSEAAASKRV